MISMKISQDKNTCNIRVIMGNPWIVRNLLRDAHLLKTEGVNISNCFYKNEKVCFNNKASLGLPPNFMRVRVFARFFVGFTGYMSGLCQVCQVCMSGICRV